MFYTKYLEYECKSSVFGGRGKKGVGNEDEIKVYLQFGYRLKIIKTGCAEINPLKMHAIHALKPQLLHKKAVFDKLIQKNSVLVYPFSA